MPKTQGIGGRIKQARLARNLTLKQVERKAKVSATHVSEIERGLTSPTVGALVRIADALDTPTCRLLETDGRSSVSVVRAAERLVLAHAGGEAAACFHRLSDGVRGAEISVFMIELDAGPGDPVQTLPHDGEGWFHVLRGVVELREAGAGTADVLKEGDSLHGKGWRSVRNIGEGPARVLWTVTPPLHL